MSSLKGTGGKPQNADCYILMERAGNAIKVLVSSKETDQKPRFLLNVSQEGSAEEKFTYAGDLEVMSGEMAAIGETNRKKVLDAIAQTGEEISREGIEKITGLKENAVKNHLKALLSQDGSLITTNGKKGKATRYKRVTGIGREEKPARPNAKTEAFSLS